MGIFNSINLLIIQDRPSFLVSLPNFNKDKYDYVDLNGITGDFSDSNPYKGLNQFKLGFNPYIYELIGEFDLVINPKLYEILLATNLLQKEFKDFKKD